MIVGQSVHVNLNMVNKQENYKTLWLQPWVGLITSVQTETGAWRLADVEVLAGVGTVSDIAAAEWKDHAAPRDEWWRVFVFSAVRTPHSWAGSNRTTHVRPDPAILLRQLSRTLCLSVSLSTRVLRNVEYSSSASTHCLSVSSPIYEKRQTTRVDNRDCWT